MPQNSASRIKGRPKLVEERRRLRWSQQKLADQAGTTFVSISRWERGITEPNSYNRQRLAKLFGKSLEEIDLLLLVVEETNPPQAEDAWNEQADLYIDPLPSPLSSADEPGGTQNIPEPAIIPIASQALLNSTKYSNRQRLLNRVHMFWIRGLLEPLLQQAILIELRLRINPEAVLNPWYPVLNVTSDGLIDRTEEMSILDIYDVVAGELLILGQPGSGKTTLLLELTSVLLRRADEDETHPIPVIFNLCSWSQKADTLTNWLIEELSHKYHVPQQLCLQWLEQDLILPLLDGLDEVTTRQRTACIEAINTYRQAHGLYPMVVCSRQEDYFEQEGRLLLRSAVCVQALTAPQVEQYLQHLGEPATALRVALAYDPVLQAMTTTPFLLSILLQVYGANESQAAEHPATIRERRLQDIFTLYVQRALEHRWKPALYSRQDVLRWLHWLASQLQQHHDSIFYLEAMQPDWLTQERSQRIYAFLAVRLVMMILGMLILLSLWTAMDAPGALLREVLVSLVIGGFLGGIFGGRIIHFLHFSIENSQKKPALIRILSGIMHRRVPEENHSKRNYGIRRSCFNGLLIGGISFIVICIVYVLLSIFSKTLINTHPIPLRNYIWLITYHAIFIGITMGLILGLLTGWLAAIQHFILRILLWREGSLPWHYSAFLDAMAAHMLLQKVGGGYIFIHRLLLEYLAAHPSEPVSERQPLTALEKKSIPQ